MLICLETSGKAPMFRQLLYTCLLSLLAGDACPQGMPGGDLYLKQQVALIPAAESAPEQFASILHNAGIPGGIVSVYGGCAEYPRRGQPVRSNVSVSQALDALAREDVSHRWEDHDGAVVFLPAGSVPAFLETRVSSVHLADTGNITLSLQEFCNTRGYRRREEARPVFTTL